MQGRATSASGQAPVHTQGPLQGAELQETRRMWLSPTLGEAAVAVQRAMLVLPLQAHLPTGELRVQHRCLD